MDLQATKAPRTEKEWIAYMKKNINKELTLDKLKQYILRILDIIDK